MDTDALLNHPFFKGLNREEILERIAHPPDDFPFPKNVKHIFADIEAKDAQVPPDPK